MFNENQQPVISVLMSIYREPVEWIKESIGSILNQTFSSFELIVVLDAPDYDGNQEVYKLAEIDNRIRIIENDVNKGLTASLILAMRSVRGKYIARMDADDIAEPHRFEKQLQYMENNRDVSVVGSYVDVFSEDGTHTIGMNNLESDKEKNKIKMLFCNAGVVHSSAFIRKSFLDEYQIGYDVNMKKSQDYGLWVDIVLSGGEIQIVPEVLIRYRVHANQITNKSSSEQQKCYSYALGKQLIELGITPTETDINIHRALFYYHSGLNPQAIDEYICKLINANNRRGIYDKEKFKSVIFSLYGRFITKAIIKEKEYVFIKSKYIKTMLYPKYLREIYLLCVKDKEYRKILKDFLKKE